MNVLPSFAQTLGPFGLLLFKGSTTHSCFLNPTDSLFKNNRRSTTIKAHNVICYDIESQLEQYYKCKVERPEMYDELTGKLIQSRMTVHKTQSFHTLDEVNDFKTKLSKEEK